MSIPSYAGLAGFIPKTSNMFCPSDGLIPDPLHPGLCQKEAWYFKLSCLQFCISFFSQTASSKHLTSLLSLLCTPYLIDCMCVYVPPTLPSPCSSKCQWIIVGSAAIPESLVALYLLLAWHRRTGATSRCCHFVFGWCFAVILQPLGAGRESRTSAGMEGLYFI